MARRRTKKRTHTTWSDPTKGATVGGQPLNASASRTPKTMVIRVGASEVGPSISELVRDVRTMMEPHTASRLRERKSNRLKDYTTMAGPLGVTQLLLFSRNAGSGSANLRIARCPRGPTIHFRVKNYSLCRDVRKSLRNPKTPGKEFSSPPLLVMNNFATPQPPNADGTPGRPPPHEALLTSMFQSLFPPISAQRTPLSSIRRVLLLDRQPILSDSGEAPSEYVIEARHYLISTKAVGLSKPIRRLDAAQRAVRPPKTSRKNALPNLGRLEDIADYMLDPAAAGGYTSESEVEEDAEVEVLPSTSNKQAPRKKRTPKGPEKCAIKLSEIGPRMKLEMVKIEEGLAEGKVLWHAWEKKTKAEERKLEIRHKQRKEEKDRRRGEQMENIKRKKAERAAAGEREGECEEGEVGDGDDEEMWDDDDSEEESEEEGEDGEDEEMEDE
ncbi:Brix-domain-containing protein [Tuber magnatum]|uniref:Brix-domain-containing protein n=1 Tax=Tuber magnatum TaxID=42249 RepID=A0A317SH29_9PEZI|nr:Brix-domain-containing protein [Tuber magnatum]